MRVQRVDRLLHKACETYLQRRVKWENFSILRANGDSYTVKVVTHRHVNGAPMCVHEIDLVAAGRSLEIH